MENSNFIEPAFSNEVVEISKQLASIKKNTENRYLSIEKI